MKNLNIKFIDLFAGIGGIRLGVENVFDNAECVMTSEIDKYSIETYKANFEDSNIKGDIRNIKNNEIPRFDMLLAGFPCQPFSQAGLGKGFKDDRGNLFFEIKRILISKQPDVFLLENVKGLRTHDKGDTLKRIIYELNDAGYTNVYHRVLNARDFGIPQNRERIYIIGFFNNSVTFSFPHPLFIPTRVGSILEKNNDKYTISDKIWEGHQRRKALNKKNGKGFGYRLFNEDSEYTSTISARYYKDGSEILIDQKGKNPRKITPREAANLQGFSSSFNIPVSDTQSYKQFGNSVCVPVIEAIAKNIKISLFDNEEQYK